MELRVAYSFDYLKQIFSYILVPVFIVLLIIVVGLFIYARVEKDHTTEKYNYTINFWSYLMCLLLSATLFAIALSFVISLYNSIDGRPVDKSKLIYLVYLSPLVPLAFLINTGYQWIKLFFNRSNTIDTEENNSSLEEENKEIENKEEPIENNNEEIKSDVEVIPLDSNIDNKENIAVTPFPVNTLDEKKEEVENDEELENLENNDVHNDEVESLEGNNVSDIEVLDDEGDKI